MHSMLGEPLRFQVGVTTGVGEKVDESCFFLTVPDPDELNLRAYFSHARMAITLDGGRQYLSISSSRPFDELFARVQLQIKCPGVANISKILTILPDLETSPAPLSVASVPVVKEQARAENKPPVAIPMPAGVSISALPARTKPAGKEARTSGEKVVVRHSRIARARHGGQAIFRLKLSGEPIDESRIGKISPEERELLLAQQKLLDADDQTAKYLELQHQVKRLQDELGLIKLKLEKIDLGASASGPSTLPVKAEGTAGPGERQGAPAKPSGGTEQEDQNTQLGLLIGAGFLLAVLLLWQVLRRHANRKAQQEVQPDIKHPADQHAESGIDLPRVISSPSAPRGFHAADTSSDAFAAAKETAQPAKPIKTKEELAEDDSMLEEAELYAAHGHSSKAIEILREIIAKNPTYTEAWMLLMSILSSLGQTKDFESAARDFYRKNPQSESWKMMQALGRTLDRDNPLYAGDRNLDVAAKFLQQLALSKKRLVGDILVEMGVLSEQDLMNTMRDFDSKKHGRFGGYLVSRKMITHAQLSEALILQQGIGGESESGTRLILQEMENLLSDFDPERDGSIGEYLVSRGVITAEQLEKTLHSQDSVEEPSNYFPDPNQPADDSEADDATILWEQLPVRDKMTRKREVDSDTVDLPIQESTTDRIIPLGEIDFDIGSDMKDKPDT